MDKRNKTVIYIVSVLIVMALVLSYAGRFLFAYLQKKANADNIYPEGSQRADRDLTRKEDSFPVQYKHITTEVNGNRQEINILEVDLKDKRVELKPVLSHDSIFGFEKLSDMVAEKGAYAAVNAGFFYEYGQPIGMVVIDGKILNASTGKFPVYVFDGEKAEIKQLETRLRLMYNGVRFDITGVNIFGKSGDTVIYTREYGMTNMAKSENFTLTVVNGEITDVKRYMGEVPIPRNGMLVTFFGSASKKAGIESFKPGDKLDVQCEPALNDRFQAYECGSWVVKDGKIAIPEKDDLIGVMTNYDPRTAIGIKNDGKVVLVTVDGRQPGYSVGFTGKELAQFLIDYGIMNAAMLDGGASTEMIVEGRLVNRPSFKGEERLLAGGLIVKVIDN